MRSDDVKVSLENLAPVLDMIEKTTLYIGYDEAFAQKMRLIGEELIQSCSHMIDELSAYVWMDTDEKNMYIHLKLEGVLSEAKRDELIEISKSGRNEQPKGLLKRIAAFFETAFMNTADGYVPAWSGYDYTSNQYASVSMMDIYNDELRRREERNDTPDELKGIEAAMLKSLADDVTVAARPSTAELTVTKKLPGKA